MTTTTSQENPTMHHFLRSASTPGRAHLRPAVLCVAALLGALCAPSLATAALPSVDVHVVTTTLDPPVISGSHRGRAVSAACPSGTLVGGGGYLRNAADPNAVPTPGLVLGGTTASTGSSPVDTAALDGALDPSHWLTIANFTGVSELGDQGASFALCATGGTAHTVVKTATTIGANAAQTTAPPILTIATCPLGTRLIGGGSTTSTPDQINDGTTVGNNGNLKPMASYPSDTAGVPAADGSTSATSWSAYGSAGIKTATDNVTAYALCSTDAGAPPVQVARVDASPPTGVILASATCPTGTRLLGGGYDADQGGLQPQQGFHMRGSYPSNSGTTTEVADGASNPDTWTSLLQAGGVPTAGFFLHDFAMCATQPAPPALVFSSTPPSPARYGGTYAVATSGGSADPVTFSIASASAGVCALAPDGVTVTFTGVGACTIAADQANSGLHAVQVVTVDPAPLSITASDEAMTYGGAPPAITPSYSGFVNGDGPAALDSPPVCGTDATATTPVGSAASSCSGAASADYDITYTAGTVTIARAPLTITASDATMQSGGPAPAVTASYDGFVNGESPAVLETLPTCSANVAAHTTSCSGAAGSNYAISYVDGTLTITTAATPLTVRAPSLSLVYGSSVPASFTPTYTGLTGGDVAPATRPTCTTVATSTSPVGTYAITCSGASDPKYAISYTAGVLTITARRLTITASNGSMTYGGPSPAIAPIYSGFAAGQNASLLATAPTCSANATPVLAAGTYPGRTTCSGAASPNFTFAYVAGRLTLNRAPVRVTAPSFSVRYGAAIPSPLRPTYSGLVNGATAPATPATCSTTATSGTAVGTKPVTCKGAADANYTFTYVAGTATITKAPTTLRTLGLISTGFHPSAVLTSNVTGGPIAGQPVTIRLGTRIVCTATTNASGVARCPGVIAIPSFTATFAGSANYLGSVAP